MEEAQRNHSRVEGDEGTLRVGVIVEIVLDKVKIIFPAEVGAIKKFAQDRQGAEHQGTQAVCATLPVSGPSLLDRAFALMGSEVWVLVKSGVIIRLEKKVDQNGSGDPEEQDH